MRLLLLKICLVMVSLSYCLAVIVEHMPKTSSKSFIFYTVMCSFLMESIAAICLRKGKAYAEIWECILWL